MGRFEHRHGHLITRMKGSSIDEGAGHLPFGHCFRSSKSEGWAEIHGLVLRRQDGYSLGQLINQHEPLDLPATVNFTLIRLLDKLFTYCFTSTWIGLQRFAAYSICLLIVSQQDFLVGLPEKCMMVSFQAHCTLSRPAPKTNTSVLVERVTLTGSLDSCQSFNSGECPACLPSPDKMRHPGISPSGWIT